MLAQPADATPIVPGTRVSRIFWMTKSCGAGNWSHAFLDRMRDRLMGSQTFSAEMSDLNNAHCLFVRRERKKEKKVLPSVAHSFTKTQLECQNQHLAILTENRSKSTLEQMCVPCDEKADA
jgi:hypothetical protein